MPQFCLLLMNNNFKTAEEIRTSLINEYLSEALYEAEFATDVLEIPSLSKAIRLGGKKDPWVDYIYGKMHLKKGEVKTALNFYRKAASKATGKFEIYYELGKLLTTASTQYEESIYNLSKALELNKLPVIYVHRALMYCKVGKVAAADADIALFINSFLPDYNGTLMNAGHWFVDDHFLTQANTLYRAALQKNEQYESQLTQKKEKDTRDMAVYAYNEQLLSNANRRLIIYTGLQITTSNGEQAQVYAQKALALTNTDADTLFSAGFVLDRGGNKMEEAEQYYDRALAKDPHFIKALNNKCLIRLAQEDYDGAWQLADQLLSLDASFAGALITKANVCFYRGELPAALKFYEEYTILKPDSATGYSGMGFIMCHLGRDADAIPLLQKAILLATEQDMDVNEWWWNLANCYCNMGEYEKAITAAEKSIAILPDYYYAYYVLACVYAKQNQKEKALEMVQQVLNYNPDKRDTLLNEADLAAIRGDIVNLLSA